LSATPSLYWYWFSPWWRFCNRMVHRLKGAIVPLLGLVMFGMGLTLKLDDFAEVARHPWRVALGVVAHFVIMPGVAWLLCQAVPPAAGNRRGRDPGRLLPKRHGVQRDDLAGPRRPGLSVAIAAVTTLLAPLLTPA
jgi:BASS family bile acid:Na+ symporter